MESDSDHSLKAFCTALGKFLSIGSKNYLFLNGIRAKNNADIKSFIAGRVETIGNSRFIQDWLKQIEGNFFLGFWPVPPLWDTKMSITKDVSDHVRIFEKADLLQ